MRIWGDGGMGNGGHGRVMEIGDLIIDSNTSFSHQFLALLILLLSTSMRVGATRLLLLADCATVPLFP